MFEHWAVVKVRKGETNNSHQTRVKQLLASHGMPNKYQLQRQEGFGGQICKCEICKKHNLSFLNSPWVPSVPWVLICQKDPSKKKHVKLTEHTHLRYGHLSWRRTERHCLHVTLLWPDKYMYLNLAQPFFWQVPFIFIILHHKERKKFRL